MERKSHFTEKREEASKPQTNKLRGVCFVMVCMLASIMTIGNTYAQETNTLTGTVVDNTLTPVPGVSVVIVETNNGTMTDVNGEYSIQVKKGQQVSFSFIGFSEQVITYTGQKKLNITLTESTKLLGEVVVTALGIKRESKSLGYNVQEMKSETVNNVKSVNFVNALAGKVAGVTISSSSAGVGGATKVVSRGPTSLSQSNNVLYVIDGVPMYNTGGAIDGSIRYNSVSSGEGISDLNSEDIESISVLSGAAASALYGSDAGNGVILITTKKGKEGKIEVKLSSSMEFSSPFIEQERQNRYGSKDGSFTSWATKPLETPSAYRPTTDFLQRGSSYINSVSLSTGSAKNQTYLSLGSSNADGLVPNNYYNKYNASFRNTTLFLNDKMTLDASLNLISQEDNNLISRGTYFNPLPAAYLYTVGENFDQIKAFERWDPMHPDYFSQYWVAGDQGLDMQNPFWAAYRNNNSSNSTRYLFNLSLKYDVLDWLSLSARARTDNKYTTHETKLHATTDGKLSGPKGRYVKRESKNNLFFADFMANINKQLSEDFNLSALVGASNTELSNTNTYLRGDLNRVPNFFTLNNLDKDNENFTIRDNMIDRYERIAAYASADLSYKNFLYLTLTAREEWSSQLAIYEGMSAQDYSFFYPSVGLSAILSDVISMPEWVTFLKVRGSYAEVGIAPTSMLRQTYPTDPVTGLVTPTSIYLPTDLKEERTNSFELGANVKLFNNKLAADVTLYKATTSNQTFLTDVDPFSGYNKMMVQAGAVENRGIEATLGYTNTWNHLRWSSNIVYTLNRNKIKTLVNNLKDPFSGKDLSFKSLDQETYGSYKRILKEGGSVGDIYTTTELMRDDQGDLYVNGGTGSLQQIYKLRKVGSSMPKYNTSWSNEFDYKGFSVSALISARIGGEVISITQSYMDLFGVGENTAIARDQGGVLINGGLMSTEKYYQIASGPEMLSNYVYSATNVRLQEMSIGYRIPKKWVGDIFDAKLSIVGRNLFMFYNKAPFDPEKTLSTGNNWQGVDFFSQPSTRSFGFSLDVTF